MSPEVAFAFGLAVGMVVTSIFWKILTGWQDIVEFMFAVFTDLATLTAQILIRDSERQIKQMMDRATRR